MLINTQICYIFIIILYSSIGQVACGRTIRQCQFLTFITSFCSTKPLSADFKLLLDFHTVACAYIETCRRNKVILIRVWWGMRREAALQQDQPHHAFRPKQINKPSWCLMWKWVEQAELIRFRSWLAWHLRGFFGFVFFSSSVFLFVPVLTDDNWNSFDVKRGDVCLLPSVGVLTPVWLSLSREEGILADFHWTQGWQGWMLRPGNNQASLFVK